MAEKIKVLFQLNQLGYGGTEKAVLNMCRKFNRDIIDPYLFYYSDEGSIKYYRRFIMSKLSANEKKKFEQRYETKIIKLPYFINVFGAQNIYKGSFNEFIESINKINPDIIHFNRGNKDDFYTEKINEIPDEILCLETNIFGHAPSVGYYDRINTFYFISKWLMNKSPWHKGKGKMVYYPTKPPAHSNDLRKKLGIDEKSFVMGRIGRPDLRDDNFILNIFNEVRDENTYLIILSPTEIVRENSRNYKNIILIEPTVNENELTSFYNSLDILLHRRFEGETFGLNIAEGMIHGKPVVSHRSSVDNSQAELLSDNDFGIVGFVAEENNFDEYVNYVLKFKNDENLRKTAGENARRKARSLYLDELIAKRFELEYRDLIKKTKN